MSGMIEQIIERVLLGESKPAEVVDTGSVYKIIVCQRGFVYAGKVDFSGEYIVVRDAVNIRKWGTTSGLGQLALQGKQSETVLDRVGTLRVHKLAVVSMIDCEVPLV